MPHIADATYNDTSICFDVCDDAFDKCSHHDATHHRRYTWGREWTWDLRGQWVELTMPVVAMYREIEASERARRTRSRTPLQPYIGRSV